MDIVTLLNWILGPLLAILTLLFILRIVLTWYPQINLNQFPYNLVSWPTEPFLAPTRRVIPPLGGVDITPVIWVFLVSLIQQLFLGPQGLVNLIF
uniref:YggT family protein n=1 Tax=Cyanothece sp. (strain PCC 7425 / ATCC 29141) TaxID=395961 RepID=B8HPJ0_CYAP4